MYLYNKMHTDIGVFDNLWKKLFDQIYRYFDIFRRNIKVD